MKKALINIGLFAVIGLALWFLLVKLEKIGFLSKTDYKSVLISFLIVIFLVLVYGVLSFFKNK